MSTLLGFKLGFAQRELALIMNNDGLSCGKREHAHMLFNLWLL